MNLGTILVVILILFLVGALPTWPHSANWGYYPSGGLGLVLLILLLASSAAWATRSDLPMPGAPLMSTGILAGMVLASISRSSLGGKWTWFPSTV